MMRGQAPQIFFPRTATGWAYLIMESEIAPLFVNLREIKLMLSYIHACAVCYTHTPAYIHLKDNDDKFTFIRLSGGFTGRSEFTQNKEDIQDTPLFFYSVWLWTRINQWSMKIRKLVKLLWRQVGLQQRCVLLVHASHFTRGRQSPLLLCNMHGDKNQCCNAQLVICYVCSNNIT